MYWYNYQANPLLPSLGYLIYEQPPIVTIVFSQFLLITLQDIQEKFTEIVFV
jgi:hypothetical protein